MPMGYEGSNIIPLIPLKRTLRTFLELVFVSHTCLSNNIVFQILFRYRILLTVPAYQVGL